MRPADRRNVPETAKAVRNANSHPDEQELTVKFNDIVPDALHGSPATCNLLWQQTLFLGLVLGVSQDTNHRGCKDRQDDGKSTISPAPVICVELLGCGGTTVGGNNVGR